MKDNTFKLISLIDKLDDYSRRYIVVSIPKVYTDLRIHYLDELYNLRQNALYAFYNKGNIRIKYLISLQVNLSLLDSLLIQIKKLIGTKKKYEDTALGMLNDIKNIIYGWKYNEEKK